MHFVVRAGARVVPALLFVALLTRPVGAIPKDDPLAEPGEKPQVSERAPSPLENAATRVASELRSSDSYLPTRGAVDFALLLYAESRKPRDLETAVRLARGLLERDPVSAASLFRVAQAGGSTLDEAEAAFANLSKTDLSSLPTESFARFVQDSFARSLALGDSDAVGEAVATARRFFSDRSRVVNGHFIVVLQDDAPPSLADYVESLRAAIVTASISGRVRMRNDLVPLGLELVRRFWDKKDDRLRDRRLDDDDPSALRLNAEAALALWEAGFLGGNPEVREIGKRALDSVLAKAIGSEEAAPAAALAAARLSSHPVQMVLIGTAGDPRLRALREAGSFLFEPRRVILNLDPAADATRIEELAYPAELAPVLFVCVETICSAPIRTAAGLEAKVQNVVKIADGVPE